jgi:tetratricopeptide (TPR) repeat protein
MAEYIWKRYFQTKEQRAQTESFVPTEYENIYIDSEGFIYATNIVFSEYDLKSDSAKPIRRLNSLGNDILIKNDRFPPIGDLWWVEQGSEGSGPSKFVDITVMNNDIYVALDRTRGRLFGYDSQGVLLWAFGTKGNVEGAFTGAISIEHMGYDLLVMDQLENSITLFQTTEYGQTIYDASEAYLRGEYDESAELWRNVLKMNANYPLAFRGIGRAILRQNQYEQAMDYFKLAHDRQNYGRAFKLYRKEWVEANIGWILLIVGAALLIPLGIGRVRRMKREVIMHEHSKVRK